MSKKEWTKEEDFKEKYLNKEDVNSLTIPTEYDYTAELDRKIKGFQIGYLNHNKIRPETN